MNISTAILLLVNVFLLYIHSCQALSCYQCDSRNDPDCKEEFDWQHLDQLIIRPTECEVHDAAYCVKTTGVWGGVVGTTRFCSSRDMFNSCQYVTFRDHDRIYRACIFTCGSDGCNGSVSVTASATVVMCLAAVITAFVTILC
jgi:hypothetical protein